MPYGVLDPPGVLLSPRNAEIAAGLAARFATVDVAADNQAVVDGAEVVIVCVRPQVAETVLAEPPSAERPRSADHELTAGCAT